MNHSNEQLFALVCPNISKCGSNNHSWNMWVTASYFSHVPARARHFLIETADETAVDEATILNQNEPDREVGSLNRQMNYDHCVCVTDPCPCRKKKTVLGGQWMGWGGPPSWLGGDSGRVLPEAKLKINGFFFNFLIWVTNIEISVKNSVWGLVEWVGDQLTGWGGCFQKQNSKINALCFLKFFDLSDRCRNTVFTL